VVAVAVAVAGPGGVEQNSRLNQRRGGHSQKKQLWINMRKKIQMERRGSSFSFLSFLLSFYPSFYSPTELLLNSDSLWFLRSARTKQKKG
jgi:hypothetical protein